MGSTEIASPRGGTGTSVRSRGIDRARVRDLALAAGLSLLGGVIAAWLTPRGPTTTPEALAWMAAGVAVGVAATFVARTRWAIPLAAVAFTLAFEIGRAGTRGPTVEGIHLGSTYGLIAFVVGRGLSYLLALVPLVFGGLVGIALASRLRRPQVRALGVLGWLVLAGTGLLTIGLVVMFARPPSTASIEGVGEAPPIAELTRVQIGGHDQALMIRGRSTENPVLLHLAGGPGGTDLGAMRADTSLEQDFVVVTWDQRGTGKSYDAIDPVETLTLDQMVADTIELSDYLRERFQEEAIYVHGNSWGSTLGVLAAQQRPDLFHAFIGSGQMVSQRETDIMFWEDTIAWAEDSGNAALAETLRASGPPPYEDILDYEPALSHEHDWNPYPEFDGDRELPFTLFVPENTLMDQVNGLRAFLDTFSILYPQLQEIDFRQQVTSLDVPLYMVMGAHEARGRAVLAEEWFDLLAAPSKQRIIFEHSGHRPSFEEPGRFAELMRQVRDETYPTSRPALGPT